jgi:hypothetical protein
VIEMLKKMAVVFGVVFLLIGVLGFVPGATRDGHLLGIFHINTAHNIVHLLSGAVALLAGLTSEKYSQWYFRLFGIVYGLVAVLGFFYQDRPILGLIANNMADVWLHIAITVVALYLGFAAKSEVVAHPGDRHLTV